LTQEIEEFEEERKMPYVTSFERVGEVRGQARTVLSQLAEVCGSVPEDCEERVRGMSTAELDKLAKALLRFQSLADLQSWLDQHGPAHE
jgi:hypothetical protein